VQKLTQRQEMVLDFIRISISDRGYPPTLREIGNHMGIRSTNGVNDHLRALERKGYLMREDMKSRALRPISIDANRIESRKPDHQEREENGYPANDNMAAIPIVGRVAAGRLAEAIENPEGFVRIERALFSNADQVFCLRVAGESMVDAGIHNGDLIFVRKSVDAQRGDIIVALVGDEATCKYYYPEGDYVRLEPANDRIQPIIIHKSDWRSAQVLGVVAGLYRKYV
jgi:repressor LexA